MSLSLEIKPFLQLITIFSLLGFAWLLWRGIRHIQAAGDMPFFLLRRKRLSQGWRLIFWSIGLGLMGILTNVFGEPVAYRIYPVTETPTFTPTLTLTPTTTLTPSITPTASQTPTLRFTHTPTSTSTPQMPLIVAAEFESQVTPSADVAFSALVFSKGYDEDFLPILPGTVFNNPVGHLYAIFSYDGMSPGVQWTALWLRDGELVYYETKLWDGTTGGFGFTDWDPSPDAWLPGSYQVQIFVGMEWKSVGFFDVQGEAPTAVPTLTPTVTTSPTPSLTPTLSPNATNSPAPDP